MLLLFTQARRDHETAFFSTFSENCISIFQDGRREGRQGATGIERCAVDLDAGKVQRGARIPRKAHAERSEQPRPTVGNASVVQHAEHEGSPWEQAAVDARGDAVPAVQGGPASSTS